MYKATNPAQGSDPRLSFCLFRTYLLERQSDRLQGRESGKEGATEGGDRQTYTHTSFIRQFTSQMPARVGTEPERMQEPEHLGHHLLPSSGIKSQLYQKPGSQLATPIGDVGIPSGCWPHCITTCLAPQVLFFVQDLFIHLRGRVRQKERDMGRGGGCLQPAG